MCARSAMHVYTCSLILSTQSGNRLLQSMQNALNVFIITLRSKIYACPIKNSIVKYKQFQHGLCYRLYFESFEIQYSRLY